MLWEWKNTDQNREARKPIKLQMDNCRCSDLFGKIPQGLSVINKEMINED